MLRTAVLFFAAFGLAWLFEGSSTFFERLFAFAVIGFRARLFGRFDAARGTASSLGSLLASGGSGKLDAFCPE